MKITTCLNVWYYINLKNLLAFLFRNCSHLHIFHWEIIIFTDFYELFNKTLKASEEILIFLLNYLSLVGYSLKRYWSFTENKKTPWDCKWKNGNFDFWKRKMFIFWKGESFSSISGKNSKLIVNIMFWRKTRKQSNDQYYRLTEKKRTLLD